MNSSFLRRSSSSVTFHFKDEYLSYLFTIGFSKVGYLENCWKIRKVYRAFEIYCTPNVADTCNEWRRESAARKFTSVWVEKPTINWSRNDGVHLRILRFLPVPWQRKSNCFVLILEGEYVAWSGRGVAGRLGWCDISEWINPLYVSLATRRCSYTEKLARAPCIYV